VLVLAGFLVGSLTLTWLVVSRRRTWSITALKPDLAL
ncbi:MAG: hypothetical protein QOG20_1272, partial [Pseudonocardiales bacterium]|nr:hypothetical protein [Pseudonocardiales bacterium]